MMSRFGNCENKQGEKYNGVFSVSKKRKWKRKKLYSRYQKSEKQNTKEIQT